MNDRTSEARNTTNPEAQKTISLAERELGAFLAAVRQQYGADAALRAADYWIEALERVEPHPAASHWRRVTLAAASRLSHSL